LLAYARNKLLRAFCRGRRILAIRSGKPRGKLALGRFEGGEPPPTRFLPVLRAIIGLTQQVQIELVDGGTNRGSLLEPSISLCGARSSSKNPQFAFPPGSLNWEQAYHNDFFFFFLKRKTNLRYVRLKQSARLLLRCRRLAGFLRGGLLPRRLGRFLAPYA